MWTVTIRHCASVALILGCLSSQASADCQADVPGARLIGSGEFCVLGFCLYDAQLWATHAPAKFDEPFALLLTYRRSVQGDRMVDIGIAEIEVRNLLLKLSICPASRPSDVVELGLA